MAKLRRSRGHPFWEVIVTDILRALSVIVPLAPDERAWTALARDLAALPAGAEVIFVGPKPPQGDAPALDGRRLRLAWLRSPKGRARQQNLAARCARGRFLWFLHADSRLASETLPALRDALEAAPDALHYFDLSLDVAEQPLVLVNNAGAFLRSRLLGMPFGDQGFCLARDAFLALGAFDETARYGEDHLLVWKARQRGIKLRPTGAPLKTSARKYAGKRWLRTTARHLALTYRQAWPEAVKLYGGRLRR